MDVVLSLTQRGRAEIPAQIPFCNVPRKGDGPVIIRLLGPVRAYHCHFVPFSRNGVTRPCYGDSKTCPHCKADYELREHGYCPAERLEINDDRKRVWVRVLLSIPRKSLLIAERAARNTILRCEKVGLGKLKFSAVDAKKYPAPDKPVHEPFNVHPELMQRWFPKGPPAEYIPEPEVLDGSKPSPQADVERRALANLFERYGVNSLAGLDELLSREPSIAIDSSAMESNVQPANPLHELAAWYGSVIASVGQRRTIREALKRAQLPDFPDHETERNLTAADYERIGEALAQRGEPDAARLVVETGRRRFPTPAPEICPAESGSHSCTGLSNCTDGGADSSNTLNTSGHPTSTAISLGGESSGEADGPAPSTPGRLDTRGSRGAIANRSNDPAPSTPAQSRMSDCSRSLEANGPGILSGGPAPRPCDSLADDEPATGATTAEAEGMRGRKRPRDSGRAGPPPSKKRTLKHIAASLLTGGML